MKEAYRRTLADLEKEKDTRETLQQCLDALNSKPQGGSNNNTLQPLTSVREAGHLNQVAGNIGRGGNDTYPRICKFYNHRNGCKYGDQCTFQHKEMPPCHTPNCRRWNCKMNHRADSQIAAATNNRDGHSNPTAGSGCLEIPCRFFNSRNGCRNGDVCKFRHNVMPRCPNERCNDRSCELNHKRFDIDNNRNNRAGFLDQSMANKPPDPIQKILSLDMQAMIQQKIEQQIEMAVSKIQQTNTGESRPAQQQQHQEHNQNKEKGHPQDHNIAMRNLNSQDWKNSMQQSNRGRLEYPIMRYPTLNSYGLQPGQVPASAPIYPMTSPYQQGTTLQYTSPHNAYQAQQIQMPAPVYCY